MSFYKIWENIQKEKLLLEQNPLQDSGDDSKAMLAIRVGNGISDTFWTDFQRLINNVDAVSELLQVRPEEISRWSHRIKDNMQKVQERDEQPENFDRKRKEVLPTGMPDKNNGALAFGNM